jgi:HEAT repeat protein
MLTRSFVVILIALAAAVVPTAAAPPNEDELKRQYDAFVESLDHRSLAEDYPGALRNLDSPDPKKQIVGITTLAATEEVAAIPLIVPYLDSEDRIVRIYAGQALNALVATHQLKRRDKSQPDKVVILPPGPGDIDLKPMSWVISKMLQKPDDGNTHAYAANMIGYLGLEEYTGELRGLLKSQHPAVTTAARRALEMIGACVP